MAFEERLYTVSLVAGADLSGAQYRFVKLTSTPGQCVLAGNGEQPYGILQNDPASGQEATVAIAGVSKLHVNGSSTNIASDADLASGADGIGKVATTGNVIAAQAREAATADGVVIAADFRTHMGTAS